MYNEAGELLNVGETTMVFIQMKSGRPTAIPPSVLKKMEVYFPA